MPIWIKYLENNELLFILDYKNNFNWQLREEVLNMFKFYLKSENKFQEALQKIC